MTHDNDDHERSADERTRETFLARWSRRKQTARSEVPAESDPPSTLAAEDTPLAPSGDDDLPPLDSLTQDSDYSAFLSPRVSDELRRAALRKLFHTAKYNVCDGLDDYWGDRRTYTPLGDTITADMRRAVERAAEQAAVAFRAAASAPEAPQPAVPDADDLDRPTDSDSDESA